MAKCSLKPGDMADIVSNTVMWDADREMPLGLVVKDTFVTVMTSTDVIDDEFVLVMCDGRLGTIWYGALSLSSMHCDTMVL